MYFPYFRGKQEEIIAIDSVKDLVAPAAQIPIIEPVRESTRATNRITRVVNELTALGGQCIIISNPRLGEYRQDFSSLRTYLTTEFAGNANVLFGVIIDSTTPTADLNWASGAVGMSRVVLIHQAQTVIPSLNTISTGVAWNIFFEGVVGPAYINLFVGSPKARIKDGFKRRNNADYQSTEFFSNNHATFSNDGYNGFGDFLTVGDYYQDSGGAAFAVALHLTHFLTVPPLDEVHIRHFISTTNATQQNPAGKFAEALTSLMAHYNGPNNVIPYSRGVQGYIDLHASQHYPNLGRPKRLSMMHHMELMTARFP